MTASTRPMSAPFILVGELAPKMAERGKGAIVDLSGVVGDFGMAGMALYGSTKAAMNLLTKAWAAELGPGRACERCESRSDRRNGRYGEGLAQIAAAAPAGRAADARRNGRRNRVSRIRQRKLRSRCRNARWWQSSRMIAHLGNPRAQRPACGHESNHCSFFCCPHRHRNRHRTRCDGTRPRHFSSEHHRGAIPRRTPRHSLHEANAWTTVWYIVTDASDASVAKRNGVVYAPDIAHLATPPS